MEDLRNPHDVVVERMPAKNAPNSEWAAHYRWAAEYYKQRGEHRHAEQSAYRATLYDSPVSTPDDDGAPAGSPNSARRGGTPPSSHEDVPHPPTAAGGPDRA